MDMMQTLNEKINQLKVMSNNIEGELNQDRNELGSIENAIQATQSERNRAGMALDQKVHAIQNLEALILQSDSAYNKMMQSIQTLEGSLNQALNEIP
mmetsp:Transcript_16916/g.18881  ORF Transcript_16916/g.18881 Transcript_16916/m.18881 type:complete len:97 (+) Transcript_16916:10-300(+)